MARKRRSRRRSFKSRVTTWLIVAGLAAGIVVAQQVQKNGATLKALASGVVGR